MHNWYSLVLGKSTSGLHHDNNQYWEIVSDCTSESKDVKHLKYVCWFQITFSFTLSDPGQYILFWCYKNLEHIHFPNPKILLTINSTEHTIDLPTITTSKSTHYKVEPLLLVNSHSEKTQIVNFKVQDFSGNWKSNLYLDYLILVNTKFFTSNFALLPNSFKKLAPFYLWLGYQCRIPKYLWQQNILSDVLVSHLTFLFFGHPYTIPKNLTSN